MQFAYSISLTFAEILLIVLYLSLGVFGDGHNVLAINALGQREAKESKVICGTINLLRCKESVIKNGSGTCNSTTTRKSFREHDYWSMTNLQEEDYNFNVTELDVNAHCQVTLCDDQELMGYCAQLRGSVRVLDSGFKEILQSNSFSVQCICSGNDSTVKNNNETHFDRNYVGVVYSPYDKYWEPIGPKGTLTAVTWNDYTEKDLRTSLEIVSEKFSYISTFGVGTASNTSEWYEGDKVAFIPKLAAEINIKAGYPTLRVSVGIFRKNDVNVVWKSRELYNAIEVSKSANQIFNGTVWGITVTSQYVTDLMTADDAIDMIKEVKEINQRDKLRLKVGIRIDKCREFMGKKRPEDDTKMPIYQDVTPRTYEPLTPFQERLQRIAKMSDYILCLYIPRLEYALDSYPHMVKKLQSEFLVVRNKLQKINPKLKLFIETGVPSQGVGNGLKNNLNNFKNYWYDMAKFAEKEGIMFHMFEALDQPWKINPNRDPQDFNGDDINGPNGTDAFYGWWRRANNSRSVYIEKALQDADTTDTTVDSKVSQTSETEKEDDSSNSKLLIFLISFFFGFILLTTVLVGYLWIKLRKAKRQIISPAYVTQFLSGGESCNSKDDNYAVALRIPYDRKYELAKEDFKIDKAAVLGSGQSGVVLKGTIKGRPEPVVFKCTTPSSTVIDIKSVMSEIKILSYIGEHSNILCILGAYTKKLERGIVYVALEFCPLGSLDLFLRKMDTSKLDNFTDSTSEVQYAMIGENGCLSGVLNPGYVTTSCISNYPGINNSFQETASPLSTYVLDNEIVMENSNVKWSHRTKDNFASTYQVDLTSFYKWAHQIASAMEYVSEKNVIHADLATRNILLTTVDQVKVCDFGLSRKLYEEMGVVHDKDTPLPWRWMAPESLKHLVFSVDSDVWSYGVTIWEIFSQAEVPYHGIAYDMQFTKQLERGMRLPQAKYAFPEIHDLLLKCWDTVPGNRPSFSEIKIFFHSLLLQSQSNQ